MFYNIFIYTILSLSLNLGVSCVENTLPKGIRIAFQQRLNHFEKNNNETFTQYYAFDDRYYNSSCDAHPVILMIAGEWKMNPDFTQFGNHDPMQSLVKKYCALFVTLEHRFYGDSKPKSWGSKLQFMSTEQAIEDIVYFVTNFHSIIESNLYQKDPWILYGCSYAGTVAAYTKLWYSELFLGAVILSSPLKPTFSLESPWINMENNIKKYDEMFNDDCFGRVKLMNQRVWQFFKQDVKILNEKLAKIDYCQIDTSLEFSKESARDLAYKSMIFSGMNELTKEFCEGMQDFDDNNAERSVMRYLKWMRSRNSNVEILSRADYGSLKNVECVDRTMNVYADHTKEKYEDYFLQWNWQQCTEWGLFFIEPNNSALFPREDERAVLYPCFAMFNLRKNDVYRNVELAKKEFTGLKAFQNGTNMFFYNSPTDPWYLTAMRQVDQLEMNATGITVKETDGLHCNCNHRDDKSSIANEAIENIIGTWLEKNR